jgi:putative nucleotidyltransferase with HDIG domain
MPDLSPYAGRWIAITEHDEVGAVGRTLKEAQHTARVTRPKGRARLAWVSPHPPHLALPAWPLARLRDLLPDEGVWLAGGAVRDLLLGRPVHDWDFAVAGDARALARRVADVLDGAYYTLDQERDAGRVLVDAPERRDHPRLTLDFAALRGATLEEDLRLRDITINAMALTLAGELIDPTGGREDLAHHRIRMTGESSFRNDPVRLLRAVRQASQLHFHLETCTELAIQAQAAAITTAAPERVRAELVQLLRAQPAAHGLQALNHLGLLGRVLPEVRALEGVKQSYPHHFADAWMHTQATISALEGLLAQLQGRMPPPDLYRRVPVEKWAWGDLEHTLLPIQNPLLAYLRAEENVGLTRADLITWGMLFHDVGKATTRTRDDEGLTHFYGHAKSGAALTRRRLQALHFPNAALDFVTTLVSAHMRMIDLGRQRPTRRACYRFYRATDDAGVGVILLALADALGVWGAKLARPRWRTLLRSSHDLLHAYFERAQEVIAPPPLLDGHDLLAMGIPQGPALGQLLASLQEAQAAGEIDTPAAAKTFIRQRYEEMSQ